MTRAYNTATTQQNSGGAVPPFAAAKNKILNGDMSIWQRGTSFTLAGSAVNNYTADRWNAQFDGTGATCTVSQQAFTPGAAPVAGYEGQYFLRWNRGAAGTSNTLNYLKQPIEDVRTLAGQTVTLSFWAKADASRTIYPQIYQEHGSGGTGSTLTIAGTANLTTSWQRFTFTGAVPNLTGKTIGANNSLTLYFIMPTGTAFTIDYWGVQVEAGEMATPFTTATGSIQGELAACQRYYTTSIPTGFTITDFSGMNPGSSSAIAWCSPGSTNDAFTTIQYPVPMRAAPTFNIYSAGNRTSGSIRDAVTGSDITVSNYSVQAGNNKGFNYLAGMSATNGRPYSFQWTASAEL